MYAILEASTENLSLMTRHPQCNESDLVERSQKGDVTAFEELFHRHQSDAYHVAYGIMGNVEDAKDMTQEAFVRAYEGISKFKRQASFRTWISRITTNLCLDEIRKRKRRRTESIEEHPVLEMKPIQDSSALEKLLKDEQLEILQQVLGILPEKYRVLILLRDIQGHSYQEIADIVGCSLGRVKSRLHEARQELKRLCVKQQLL